jgi:NAD(P)-dependent dehydrogenase (short-subunit alcohol dehydrogenase family)
MRLGTETDESTGWLAGDAILLAGATGRVGGATLATLVAEGARVIVISRDRSRAQATIDAELPAALRDRAVPFRADANDIDDVQLAVEHCIGTLGRIDALVNLAGSGFGRTPLTDSTLHDLRDNLTAFTESAYVLAMAALRAMLVQTYRAGARSRGRIVTVTAGSSKDPAPGRGLFAAAKAGVNALMLAVAREHKADGIVANALVLGGVAFAGAEKFYSAEDFAAAATPQEVADTLTFLASDRSSGINGALIDLNARETD